MSMFNLSRANTKRIRGLHAALVEVRKVGHYHGTSRLAVEAVSNMTPSDGRKYLKACRMAKKPLTARDLWAVHSKPARKAVKVELSKKYLAAVGVTDYDGEIMVSALAVWIRNGQHALNDATSDSKRDYLAAGIAKLKAALKAA